MIPTRRINLILFRAGGQAYALPLANVDRLLPMAELSRPPVGPAWLAGFLNLAGEPVPVLSLSQLFDLVPEEPGRYTPLLILREAERRTALWVDRVSRIASIAGDDVAAVPRGSSLNECVVGIVPCDDVSWLLLSAERLLLKRERRAIDDLADIERGRLDKLDHAAEEFVAP